MEIQALITIINESSSFKSSKIVRRDYEDQLQSTLANPRPIKVITGVRRSGKSFLLKRLYYKLMADGVPQENILFINFENDRLPNQMNTETLRKIFKTFATINKSGAPRYAFLDEIQNVENWHRFVRTLYDSDDINLYITGSNGKLLSGEISSILGGRVLEFAVRPFNYKEVAKYRGMDLDTIDPFTFDKEQASLSTVAQEYFETGGIPESLDLTLDLKEDFKQSLLNRIVVSDITKRHALEYPQAILSLCYFLERSLGGIASAANLARHAEISDVTVGKYIEYICQTVLISALPKFNFQTVKALETQKKYYFVDNLFCRRASLGARLENLVLSELQRKHGKDNLFFARNDAGKEIDFIIVNNQNRIAQAYQVCYELNDSNYTREIAPLELATKHQKSPIQKYLIFATDQTSVVKKNSTVEHIHFERWLYQQ